MSAQFVYNSEEYFAITKFFPRVSLNSLQHPYDLCRRRFGEIMHLPLVL